MKNFKKMKSFAILGFLSLILFAQSCSTANSANSQTMWVSGYKSTADAGAGRMKVLKVNKSENPEQGSWELFYAPIQGFIFEEGYMKQIKVSEKKLDASQVPADGSSIQYTLVKELKKERDPLSYLNGQWMLVSINGNPINRMVVAPTLEVKVEESRISGMDGCNSYTAGFKKLGGGDLVFGPTASTKKACIKKDVSTEYYQAMEKVTSYKASEKDLKLYDAGGNMILMYLKK